MMNTKKINNKCQTPVPFHVDPTLLLAYQHYTTLPIFTKNQFPKIELRNFLFCPDIHGYYPLHYATAFGHGELVSLILSIEPRLVECRDRQGKTPLLWALTQGHSQIFQFLLKKGSNLNTQDNEGVTPLHLSIYNFPNSDIAKFLLQMGSDPNLPTLQGVTPLHLAAELGDPDLCDILIRHGAVVDARDDQGETPLFYALRGQHEEVVKLLVLDFKSDLDCKNDDFESLVDFCESVGHEDMIKLLEELALIVDKLMDQSEIVSGFCKKGTMVNSLSLSDGERFGKARS